MKLVLLLSALGLFLISAAPSLAAGQPAPPPMRSIDAMVLMASSVSVATVSSISTEPSFRHTAMFTVNEVIKGVPPPSITGIFASKRTDAWNSGTFQVIVFTDVDKETEVVDLGWRVAEATEDFKIISDPDALLDYVRAAAKRQRGEDSKTVGLMIPDPSMTDAWQKALGYRWTGALLVPADAALEKRALQDLDSPIHENRNEGLYIIRSFKSRANIGRVKKCLSDPYNLAETYVFGKPDTFTSSYPVREAAYNTLLFWHVKTKKPETTRTVPISEVEMIRYSQESQPIDLSWLGQATQLKTLYTDFWGHPDDTQMAFLGGTTSLQELRIESAGIDDEKFAHLSALNHLQFLDLAENPITNDGLKTIAQMSSLKKVNLVATEVTDAGLAALRKSRPDLMVVPVNAVSPLHVYAMHGDLDGAKRVLELMPYAVDEKMSATPEGDSNDLIFLAIDAPGATPLLTAASHGDADIMRLLLDHGADPNARDDNGETPLLRAAHRGSLGAVELLLSRGAKVNQPATQGDTALHEALSIGTFNTVVPLLLACGADPVLENGKQQMPFQMPTYTSEGPESVLKFMTLCEHPISIVPQTTALCPNVAYELNKSNASLAEWSSQKTGKLTGDLQWSRTPSGRNYLGPFGQQAVTLHLSKLPAHKNVRIDIDLFIIGSWDGNGGLGDGPDILDISIPGTGTLLHSTFFNNTEDDAAGLPMQSFPDPFPAFDPDTREGFIKVLNADQAGDLSGFHKGYTGAAEVRSLGFKEPWDGRVYSRDAVYKLSFTIAHSNGDMDVVLTGLTVPQPGIQTLDADEHWGIGKLSVHVD